MVPPAANRIVLKANQKSGEPVITRLSKAAPTPSDTRIRKPAGRAADPAGKIREGAAPLSEVPPAPRFVPSQMLLAEKTVTVKEAAFRLGKSPDAIYRWLRTGRLRGRQPGGRGCTILVVESSVNEALCCSFQRAGAGRQAPAVSLPG